MFQRHELIKWDMQALTWLHQAPYPNARREQRTWDTPRTTQVYLTVKDTTHKEIFKAEVVLTKTSPCEKAMNQGSSWSQRSESKFRASLNIYSELQTKIPLVPTMAYLLSLVCHRLRLGLLTPAGIEAPSIIATVQRRLSIAERRHRELVRKESSTTAVYHF